MKYFSGIENQTSYFPDAAHGEFLPGNVQLQGEDKEMKSKMGFLGAVIVLALSGGCNTAAQQDSVATPTSSNTGLTCGQLEETSVYCERCGIKSEDGRRLVGVSGVTDCSWPGFKPFGYNIQQSACPEGQITPPSGIASANQRREACGLSSL